MIRDGLECSNAEQNIHVHFALIETTLTCRLIMKEMCYSDGEQYTVWYYIKVRKIPLGHSLREIPKSLAKEILPVDMV